MTVKIRIGWDAASSDPVGLARRIAAAGADAISIHARTAAQLYGGKAEWGWIRAVKQAVSIPVIGNGDVTSPSLATEMIRETGCDAVMIGRATMGNPWLLSSIVREWRCGQGHERPPDWADFRETVHGHLDLLGSERRRPPGHYRKVLMWYSKGCPDSASLRSRLDGMDRLADMLKAFEQWAHQTQRRGIPFESRKRGSTASIQAWCEG